MIAAVVLLAAGSGVHAAPQRPLPKRVAVTEFDAEGGSRARMAVLEMLSEHDDVEVVALKDIEVAGKRLNADPSDPAGRKKLSSEIGVDAWLEGRIEDDLASFALKAPDGRTIATTSLKGHKASVAEGLVGQKIWSAMGPWLSAREKAKRALDAQGDLALKKIQAREQELARQRQVVEDRAHRRVAQLKAAQQLAREKRAAFVAELARQETLVEERLATAKREKEDALRKQREAEEAEFMASLRESAGPPPRPPLEQLGGGEPAPSAHAAPNASSIWSAPATAAPAVAAAEPAPAQAASKNLSPATQKWLMAQGGWSSPPPPSAQPSAAVPAAARPAPANGGTNMDGLSPATRRWLEQQQMR